MIEEMTGKDNGGMLHMHGISASPGVAIGRVFVLDRHKRRIFKTYIAEHEVESEVQRLHEAVQKAEEQIQAMLQAMPDELREHIAILETHQLMLKDSMILDKSIDMIRRKMVNAEWALDHSLNHVRRLFSHIQDTYIRERIRDVEDVVVRIQDILSGSHEIQLNQHTSPVVIVASDLTPADTIQLNRRNVMAFVTEMGSRTSHTAIIARSLGIPAVVAVGGITQAVSTGEEIVVDGITGDIFIRPEQEILARYTDKQACYVRHRQDMLLQAHLPAVTQDGFCMAVKANIELDDEIEVALASGAEGVGLLRTEFLYVGRKDLPTEEELFRAYYECVKKMAPKPVTIRTLDVGGDKFLSSLPVTPQTNPALGLRAIRLCLKETDLFFTQLRAIYRASAFGEVRILFPLISGCSEIEQIKTHLHCIKNQLRAEGVPFDENVKLGVMIEVPTAVIMADLLAREVDFFSIGTNDLIQYSMAIDRVNEHVAHLYDPLHPGILRMIHRSAEAGRLQGIQVGMCGEMAGEPAYAPIMVGMGLNEISMNADSIPKVKHIIRRCHAGLCRDLVNRLLTACTSLEARDILDDFLNRYLTDERKLTHPCLCDAARH
ncbi:MAG: phosphoenolpyruvate--protein phosphotransferase [Dissulfuribacterales bacterium]